MKRTTVMSRQTNDSRRCFLSATLGAASTALIPELAMANSEQALHEKVAVQAKQVAKRLSRESLAILIPTGCGENVKPVVSAFAQLAGVNVEISEAPVDDINAELSLEIMSGSQKFDLALPATFGIPDLVSAKVIIPLTQFASKYEPANFRQDILYSIGDRFDDEIYGFQTDGDAYVMFYHRDLLESAKEQDAYATQFNTPLKIPTTWEELDRQMAFFHRPAQSLSGGLLFRTPGYLAWEWWVRFHAKGLWPLDKDLNPQIDSVAGVAALQELIDATESLAPEVTQLGLFENWERYSRGDVYCNIGWGGSQKYLGSEKSAMRGRMLFGPTPGGIVNDKLLQTPYFNWGWNYVVTSGSEVPELAYLFALFASTPAMSTESVRQTGGFFDPFRPEHYADPQIQQAYSKEFLKVHESSMRSAIPDLYLAKRNDYFQSLSRWLDRALSGKVGAADALAETAKQWRLTSARAGEQQQTRWQLLRDKYPQELRAHLTDLK
jgi:multiple sugar transport system substrate-binding protein